MLEIFISKVHHFALLNFISHFLDRSSNFSRFLSNDPNSVCFFFRHVCVISVHFVICIYYVWDVIYKQDEQHSPKTESWGTPLNTYVG